MLAVVVCASRVTVAWLPILIAVLALVAWRRIGGAPARRTWAVVLGLIVLVSGAVWASAGPILPPCWACNQVPPLMPWWLCWLEGCV